MLRVSLAVAVERFPIRGTFTIARGSKTEAVVVTVTLFDGQHQGRGECVPYARYGETVESVIAAIEAMRAEIQVGGDWAELQTRMPPGAARNAIDCAFWDLEAKRAGQRAWDLAGLQAPQPVETCFTISLGTPETMEASARAASATHKTLKIKLGSAGDIERLQAVRHGAPDASLLVDANEGWDPINCGALIRACGDARVALIEQPFPAGQDRWMRRYDWPVPTCADESVHGLETLEEIAPFYTAINIKLDKTGGLTEAMAMVQVARDMGLDVFVGCMVGTSLGMAPAMLITPYAQYVDLDGPLLLAQDRVPGLRYEGSLVHPPSAVLWG
ncbi:MAG: L-Ala-D/L-Glu epimerase [Pseudomonadota bacterium]